MRIAVTGAGGFLGLNLVRQLLERGHEVLALDRIFGKRTSPAIGEVGRAKTEIVDVLDSEQLRAALIPFGPEALFHGATLTADIARERGAFSDILHVNVVGTGHVLEAALRAGVRRMVVASSSAVYGEAVFHGSPRETDETRPTTLYGITKLAAEQAALRFGVIHGIDIRAVRIAAAFGPYEHRSGARDVMSPLFQIAEKALSGEEVRLPPGGARDWIDMKSVAEVIALLLEADNLAHTVYNLAASSVWEPTLFCEHLAAELDAFSYAVRSNAPNIDYRDDLARRRSALDTRRLRAEFGDAILAPAQAGCAAYAVWVKQNPHWFQENV